MLLASLEKVMCRACILRAAPVSVLHPLGVTDVHVESFAETNSTAFPETSRTKISEPRFPSLGVKETSSDSKATNCAFALGRGMVAELTTAPIPPLLPSTHLLFPPRHA